MSRRKRVCPPGATVALFVEGGDDELMARALLTQDVFIQVINGSTPQLVQDTVSATKKDPGWPKIKTVGVIVDACDNPANAVAIAQTVFAALSISAPTNIATVETQGPWTIGVFVVPGHNQVGGSDTLLMRTFSQNVRDCTDNYFTCVGEPSGTTEQQHKARSWAMAAVTGPKRAHDLWKEVDPNHPELAALKAFLDKLAP